jgi:non-specific serine/threonine protein kinase
VARDEYALINALSNLPRVVQFQGDLAAARRLVEEGLARARKIGDRWTGTFMLDVLGGIALAEGNYAEAQTALRESLLLRQELGGRSGIADSLERIGALAAAEAEVDCAIQLAAVATSLRAALGERRSPWRQSMLDQWLVPLQRALGQEVFESAWEAGRAMSLEQALELAQAATEQPEQPPDDSRQRGTELSPREQQVAALLAEGLTNRQIAERLVVTERTVCAHIEHILDKLGFASRHQVAVWAAENGVHV